MFPQIIFLSLILICIVKGATLLDMVDPAQVKLKPAIG